MSTKRVKRRRVNWKTLCYQADDEMNKPEVVYVFSNGNTKKSTDRTESGVYKRD